MIPAWPHFSTRCPDVATITRLSFLSNNFVDQNPYYPESSLERSLNPYRLKSKFWILIKYFYITTYVENLPLLIFKYILHVQEVYFYTNCPRGSYPFRVIYHIKWVTTSWTHSIAIH